MRSRIEAMDDQREVANNSTLVNMINNINKLGDELKSSVQLSNLSLDHQALLSKKKVLEREVLMMKTQNEEVLRENESLKRASNLYQLQLAEMKRGGGGQQNPPSLFNDKKSKSRKW